ncbi:unnamed protein product [Thelazia callipaeda]|uniref:Phospholipase A(2) n=1 Tax=Thelazia callipaeda TaxID=103827 RepID=A0A0N5CUH8_THECL|nr:unnamed protein product [Thelazia callipaeda]
MLQIGKNLLILLFTLCPSEATQYQCGPSDSPFYRLLSQLFTLPCEQSQINSCCANHDQCYDDCDATRLTCDALFCDCLDKISANIYCRFVLD